MSIVLSGRYGPFTLFDDAIANDAPLDIQSFEPEEALRWVAQIRGKDVDTAPDRIFSEFCIGK